jgi:tricorn protease
MRLLREILRHTESGVLEMYDFETQKREQIAAGVGVIIYLSANYEVLVYQSGNRLRVQNIKMLGKDKDTGDMSPGRKTGWIDLARIKLSVEPLAEWRQMFGEVWRLQREHFWTPDMSGVDWYAMKQRYEPLLERIASRSEYADIIWELLGELGTSHAYERGGDYRMPPTYRQGLLGASFTYDD